MNLYIVCLDLENKIYIKNVEVAKEVGKSFILTERIRDIKPIAKMHWDSVCKSIGTKTLPFKCASDNWERGYVFYQKIDAIKRAENYVEKLENQAIHQLEKVAEHRARLEKLRG